jgi:hypothetical protein
MEKMVSVLIILLIGAIGLMVCTPALAGCMVEDGTFYSKSKSSMTAFVIYMGRKGPGDFERVTQMVNDGRIKSCRLTSASVIERFDSGIVHVYINGIGKVYIYDAYLHCR